MATKASMRQAKYDKTHCRMYTLKLSLEYDSDIVEELDKAESKQGYIKQAIREKIARTRTEDHKRSTL